MVSLDRRRLADEILHRDIVKQYVSEFEAARMRGLNSDGTVKFSHTEPWHAVAEQHLAAYNTLVYGRHTVTPDKNGHLQPFLEDDDEAVIIAAKLMMNATPVLRKNSIEEIAVEAPMPEHILDADIFPYPTPLFFLA